MVGLVLYITMLVIYHPRLDASVEKTTTCVPEAFNVIPKIYIDEAAYLPESLEPRLCANSDLHDSSYACLTLVAYNMRWESYDFSIYVEVDALWPTRERKLSSPGLAVNWSGKESGGSEG